MAAALPAIISLIGSLAPHFMNKGGEDDSGGYQKMSTFNPQQSQLFGQTAQGLGGIQPQIMQWLQSLFSNEQGAGDAFAAPYKRQFEEQTVPGLANRFAGLGALSSSGFQQALGQAGAGLSENLAGLREGQRGQAGSSVMQMIQSLLSQNTQSLMPKQQKQPGGFQNFFTGLAPAIGQGIGTAGSSWALNKFGG